MTKRQSIQLPPPLQDEEWRPIPGYAGLYAVASLGRVRRVGPRARSRTAGILTPRPNRKGYPILQLCADGYHVTCAVHRLVAEAFLGPRPEGMEINHRDFDKTNARLSNLEYVTPRQNTEHSRERRAHGSRSIGAKLTEALVREIRARYAAGGITHRSLAIEYGIKKSTMGNLLCGHTWKHVGSE